MEDKISTPVWFYNQRAGAENLIKEANNDAGLAAHLSGRWATNCVHFQVAMLAYNLNCWLLLFNREEAVKTGDLKHMTLATARVCVSCLWQPRSGGPQDGWESATATSIRNADCCSGAAADGSTSPYHSWPDRTRTGAGDATIRRDVHKILCTSRPANPTTYSEGY
jgi:hypothetical protein